MKHCCLHILRSTPINRNCDASLVQFCFKGPKTQGKTALNKTHSTVYWQWPPHPLRQEFKSSKTESLQHWMRTIHWFINDGLHILPVDHPRQEFKDSRVYSTERDPLTTLWMVASMSFQLTITDKSSKTESSQHWTRPTHWFIDDGLHILSVDYHRQEFRQSWGFFQLIFHWQVS